MRITNQVLPLLFGGRRSRTKNKNKFNPPAEQPSTPSLPEYIPSGKVIPFLEKQNCQFTLAVDQRFGAQLRAILYALSGLQKVGTELGGTINVSIPHTNRILSLPVLPQGIPATNLMHLAKVITATQSPSYQADPVAYQQARRMGRLQPLPKASTTSAIPLFTQALEIAPIPKVENPFALTPENAAKSPFAPEIETFLPIYTLYAQRLNAKRQPLNIPLPELKPKESEPLRIPLPKLKAREPLLVEATQVNLSKKIGKALPLDS